MGGVRWRVLVGGGDRVTTVCKGQPLRPLSSVTNGNFLFRFSVHVCLVSHAINGVTVCLALIICCVCYVGLWAWVVLMFFVFFRTESVVTLHYESSSIKTQPPNHLLLPFPFYPSSLNTLWSFFQR